jgi:soluble lytic murein transglycosylase
MRRLFRWWPLALAVLAGMAVGGWWWVRRGGTYDADIRFAAARYGMDPALIKAVIWRESRFRPSVVGDAGEIGLMQLTEPAALDWAGAEGIRLRREQLFHPRTNILAGTWYLRWCLRHYPQTDDPRVFALAEYNAGRGNVLRWLKGPARTNSQAFLKRIGFPSTREYVRAVLERRSRYQKDFAPATRPGAEKKR